MEGRDTGPPGLPLLLLLLILISGAVGASIDQAVTFASFEDQFWSLLDREEYDGGSIGVIQNGQLVYTGGFGTSPEDRPVDGSTPLPVSSLSKTLTALAILKLVEDGDLLLSERVFGENGLLNRFDLEIADRRMLDITVEHLLRHQAGWDEHAGPVYDPMLNKVFVARGYNIENIEDTLPADQELWPIDIIEYMAKKPLAYTPGTSMKYSNFGYCVLGRVIEEVADMDYDIFVQHNILRPAGMMHTRIGYQLTLPSLGDDEVRDATVEIDSQLIHSLVDPMLLDSTLGWYSSVQDIARLTISLMYPGNINQLLKPETLAIMFSRPALGDNPNQWMGLGLHVRNDGAFWQDSDKYDNDVILYHVGIRGFVGQEKDAPDDSAIYNDDITFIALTANNRFRKLKSAMERLVPYVKLWPAASLHDRMLDDLADAQVRTEKEEVIMKFRLPEQYLQAYVNALRLASYAPVWFHAYRDDDDWSTHFAVIARRALSRRALHFRLEVSRYPKRLRERVYAWQAADDYAVSFVQSYVSSSHLDHVTHLVLLNKTNEPISGEALKWGMGHDLQEFTSMLLRRTAKGYTLKAQSVSTAKGGSTTVDYILERQSASSVDRDYYASYHDLTLEQLEVVAKSNAVQEFSLQYLDTHESHSGDGKPRFSAVFAKAQNAKWILQVGVKMDALTGEARNWQARGYAPKILVGYIDNEELNFAALWVM